MNEVNTLLRQVEAELLALQVGLTAMAKHADTPSWWQRLVSEMEASVIRTELLCQQIRQMHSAVFGSVKQSKAQSAATQ